MFVQLPTPLSACGVLPCNLNITFIDVNAISISYGNKPNHF